MTEWLAVLPIALLIVLLTVGPLLLCIGGAYAVLKGQRYIIDKVSNKALEERLQREGVATTALVLDAADTGSRIDAIYILTKLRLQVAAVEGVEEFTAEIVVPLSPVRIAQIVPGTTVKVLVDPISRETVLNQPRK